MKAKRIVIIIFLLFVVVATFALLEQTGKKPQTPVQPAAGAAQPVLPSPIVTAQPTYQTGMVNKTFPQTLPAYVVTSKPQIKTAASVFSLSLGLTGNPQELPTTRGVIYIWTNSNRSVTASEGSSTISYASGRGVGGTIDAPIETYNTAAGRAIAPLSNANQSIKLTQVDPQYFNPAGGDANEVMQPSGATSVQVNYQYTINGVPVYTDTSTGPSVFVRLNAKGDVLVFTAHILPTITPSNNETSLKSYAEAAQSLKNGEGRLTDLVSGQTGDQPYYFDSPPQISDIGDVALAYYYSPEQSQLIPVYVFRGVGEIGGKTVNTTTLVSAAK